jgi:hypothetical protein
MKKFALLALFIAIPALAATLNYTVKRGDTLQSVAVSNNISIADLVSQNPNMLIKTGQALVIPIKQSVTTVSAPVVVEKMSAPISTAPIVVSPPVAPGSEVAFQAYVTGYTYWDNTPPGSADISHPIIHQKAGGVGTYADPITVAVGHSILNGKDILDYPAGTKFYMPYLHRYFITEDTCGDGGLPQNGPCHRGYPSSAKAWLDIWVDGKLGTRESSNRCAEAITDVHLVIQNPVSTYPVSSGSVMTGVCGL